MKVIAKNWYHPLLIVGVFLMMTSSCKKDNLKNLATVTTTLSSTPMGLALDPSTVVTVVGNITADGGSAVTERGVCYNVVSLNAPDVRKDPTLDHCTQKISTDATSQQFSVKVSVVTSGVYILRAYVITRGGVAYGNVVTFQVGTGATSDAKVQAALLKSTQDDVTGLKQNLQALKDAIAKSVSQGDLANAKATLESLIDGKASTQALTNTIAALQLLMDGKVSTKDLTDANAALRQLIDGKVSTQALTDLVAALQLLLDAKASNQALTDARAALQSSIDGKVSTQDLTDAKTALQVLINAKASIQDLTDAKTALQLLIDAKASKQDLTNAEVVLQQSIGTKASTQDLIDAKTALQALIDGKASTKDLTDAKAALELLINAKASQSDFDAAKKRLSKIEEIVTSINPVSSLAITALEPNLVSVAITLDHISIDPTLTKPFTEIQKLEYVCFESNHVTPSARIQIPFDPNTVADNVTTVDITQSMINLDPGRNFKFIVYATMVGGKVYTGRSSFTSR